MAADASGDTFNELVEQYVYSDKGVGGDEYGETVQEWKDSASSKMGWASGLSWAIGTSALVVFFPLFYGAQMDMLVAEGQAAPAPPAPAAK